jgi:hypothetical protein
MEKFARKCDITGRGINEGWVWGDGIFYTSTMENTINEFRSDIKEGGYSFDEIEIGELLKMSDDELMDYAYDNDICYYTEWEIDEDEYYTEDGKLIETI